MCPKKVKFCFFENVCTNSSSNVSRKGNQISLWSTGLNLGGEGGREVILQILEAESRKHNANYSKSEIWQRALRTSAVIYCKCMTYL